MDLVIVVLLALLVTITLVALLWLGPKMAIYQAPILNVQAPAPIVVPAPKVEVHARSRTMGPDITIELHGASGKKLGTYNCPKHGRSPVLTIPDAGGRIGQFVADHQTPDGTWIYRQVGVERVH